MRASSYEQQFTVDARMHIIETKCVVEGCCMMAAALPANCQLHFLRSAELCRYPATRSGEQWWQQGDRQKKYFSVSQARQTQSKELKENITRLMVNITQLLPVNLVKSQYLDNLASLYALF